MSFEPTIVINRKDLVKHRDKLESAINTDNSPLHYLKVQLRDSSVVRIGKYELIVCQPELTSFNQRVRDTLTVLKVEYGISL